MNALITPLTISRHQHSIPLGRSMYLNPPHTRRRPDAIRIRLGTLVARPRCSKCVDERAQYARGAEYREWREYRGESSRDFLIVGLELI